MPGEEVRSAQSARLQTRSVFSSQKSEPVPRRDPPPPEPRTWSGVAGQLRPTMEPFQTPGQRGSPTKGVVTDLPQPDYYTNPCQTIVEGGSLAEGGVANLYSPRFSYRTDTLQAPGQSGSSAQGVVTSQPQLGYHANPLFQVQVPSESLAEGEVTGYPPQPGYPANPSFPALTPSESLVESEVTNRYPPQIGHYTSTFQAQDQRGGLAQGMAPDQPLLGYDANSYQVHVQSGDFTGGEATGLYPPQFGHHTSAFQAPAQGRSSVVANPNDFITSSEGGHETGYSYDY